MGGPARSVRRLIKSKSSEVKQAAQKGPTRVEMASTYKDSKRRGRKAMNLTGMSQLEEAELALNTLLGGDDRQA